ncbi:hypothetical protein Scep_024815 [Stephania cephalantha]|uniref:Transmembrane protein n=1 Tax=Stephania cephalantha TaxID=152367 RepID=A0AAP0HYT3_9MAGN
MKESSKPELKKIDMRFLRSVTGASAASPTRSIVFERLRSAAAAMAEVIRCFFVGVSCWIWYAVTTTTTVGWGFSSLVDVIVSQVVLV